LHTALFLVEDSPEGFANAAEDSLQFFVRVSWFFLGGPESWMASNLVVHDCLCPLIDKSVVLDQVEAPPVDDAALTLILSKIASTNPLVR